MWLTCIHASAAFAADVFEAKVYQSKKAGELLYRIYDPGSDRGTAATVAIPNAKVAPSTMRTREHRRTVVFAMSA